VVEAEDIERRVAMGQLPQASHIFVVGLARTGTHLMQSVLNTSPKVHIGPESLFLGGAPRFGGLRRRGVASLFPDNDRPLSDDEAREIVERLFRSGGRSAGRHRYWQGLASQIEPQEFLRRFLATPRRARDLLDAALDVYARGRDIGGDKTPSNLFAVPTLFEWFPEARVIHMLRDPRAVFASAMGKGFVGAGRLRLPRTKALDLLLGFWWAFDVAARWRTAAELDSAYRSRYPDGYLACRLEDLVTDPETVIPRVCAFVGVPYTPAMLDRPVVSSSFLPRGSRGIRPEVAQRWRRELHPLLARWTALLCGKALQENGYPAA
jgi:hypothetical protein